MIRCLIIRRDKTVIEKKLRPSKDFLFKSGLYIIDENGVNLYQENDRIKGSEIIFFEGNPLPIYINEVNLENAASRYLNDYVYTNALSQTARERRISLSWLRNLREYMNVKTLVWLMLIGALIYGLIVGGLPK